MNLLKLFFLMMFLGGVGGALGSILGNGLGRGGVFAGGIIGGVLLVIAAGFLAVRWRWIQPSARIWTILGGTAGFGLACLVALSTLSSPVGPAAASLLIGSGAVLGSIIGRDPHAQS